MLNLGQHGARVLRRFSLGDGQFTEPGSVIPAETLMGWPVPNRMALRDAGHIQMLDAPPGPTILPGDDPVPDQERASGAASRPRRSVGTGQSR